MRPIGVLVVVAAALTLASAAVADVPAGFVTRPALAARITAIAGKPVNVYCARDDASWQAAAQVGAQTGRDALAYADSVGGTSAFLSPTVCSALLAKLNGHAVSLKVFGAALEVLVHEAEHLAGHAPEGETECVALTATPQVARVGFGIKKSISMKQVIYGAYERHHAAIAFSPAYRGPCD